MARLVIISLLLLSSLFVGASHVSAGDQTLHGIASNYCCTAGFGDGPYLALAGGLGGRYSGAIGGYVEVCADRCARLAAVDYCQCFWGTAEQRLVDLTPTAWSLVSDSPLSRGLIPVTVRIVGGTVQLPNTTFGR